MNLRERIEAKRRRTEEVPLLVGDPSEITAELDRLRKSLAEHMEAVKGDAVGDGQEERLRGEIRAVLQQQADLVVTVHMQSLPVDEWDAMVGDLEPDERGRIDLSSVLAPLIAASCTDPDLKDDKWWAEQMTAPSWSGGDKAAFVQALWKLNAYGPAAPLGKG